MYMLMLSDYLQLLQIFNVKKCDRFNDKTDDHGN